MSFIIQSLMNQTNPSGGRKGDLIHTFPDLSYHRLLCPAWQVLLMLDTWDRQLVSIGR